MPLNISGSIVNASMADTLDTEGIVKRGLVIHLDADSLDSYPGNDISYDVSTLTNNGNLYNGTALSFDGSNDYVTNGSFVTWDIADKWTVSWWMYMTSTALQTFFSMQESGNANNLIEIITNNGDREIFINNQDGSGSTSIQCDTNNNAWATNTWTHIAVTNNGGTGNNNTVYDIYVNGVAQSINNLSGTVGEVMTNSSRKLMVATQVPLGRYVGGRLSDVKLFNTDLTAAQVSELIRSPNTTLPKGISASNLKLWWPFSEGYDGVAYDASGNNNHGTLTNGPTWVSGQIDIPQKAGKDSSVKLKFDGSNDYVDMGSGVDPVGTGEFTIQAWINSDRRYGPGWGDGIGNIIRTRELSSGDTSNGFNLTIGVDTIFFQLGDGSANNGDFRVAYTTINTWSHIVATRGSNFKIYVDGVLGGTDTDSLGDIGNYHNFRVAYNHTWNGFIDEVAFWNTELSANAIAAIYNSGPPTIDLRNDSGNYSGYTDNLKGYWRNDGVDTWKDLSGENNDGTVNGSPSPVYFSGGITASGLNSQGFPSETVNSFNFYGDNEYINLGDSSGDFSTTVTSISCWIRTTSTTSQSIINDEAGNGYCGLFLVYMEAAGTILWRRGNSSNTEWGFVSTSTINDGNWHNVVCIDNGSALSLYIDGVSETAASNPGTYSTAVASGRNVAIGVLARDYTSGNFDGNIGSISIYNRTLTQEEVLHNFNTQRDRYGV